MRFFLDLATPVDVEEVSVEKPAEAGPSDAAKPEVKDEQKPEDTTN